MPLTTTFWIQKMSAYPPNTIVKFLSGAIIFEDPETGKDAKPNLSVEIDGGAGVPPERIAMEYRHYRPQEVWLFYPDGGGERFAKTESKASADLLVRLLNENLARLKEAEYVSGPQNGGEK